MELSKLKKEIIGRAALAVIGIALLWGGWKCMAVAAEIRDETRKERREAVTRRGRRFGAAGLPMAIGIALLAGGGLFTLGAILPAGTFVKMISDDGAPKNTSTRQRRSRYDWKR